MKLITFVGGSASLAKEPAATNVDSNSKDLEKEIDNAADSEADDVTPEDLKPNANGFQHWNKRFFWSSAVSRSVLIRRV